MWDAKYFTVFTVISLILITIAGFDIIAFPIRKVVITLKIKKLRYKLNDCSDDLTRINSPGPIEDV